MQEIPHHEWLLKIAKDYGIDLPDLSKPLTIAQRHRVFEVFQAHITNLRWQYYKGPIEGKNQLSEPLRKELAEKTASIDRMYDEVMRYVNSLGPASA